MAMPELTQPAPYYLTLRFPLSCYYKQKWNDISIHTYFVHMTVSSGYCLEGEFLVRGHSLIHSLTHSLIHSLYQSFTEFQITAYILPHLGVHTSLSPPARQNRNRLFPSHLSLQYRHPAGDSRRCCSLTSLRRKTCPLLATLKVCVLGEASGRQLSVFLQFCFLFCIFKLHDLVLVKQQEH